MNTLRLGCLYKIIHVHVIHYRHSVQICVCLPVSHGYDSLPRYFRVTMESEQLHRRYNSHLTNRRFSVWRHAYADVGLLLRGSYLGEHTRTPKVLHSMGKCQLRLVLPRITPPMKLPHAIDRPILSHEESAFSCRLFHPPDSFPRRDTEHWSQPPID